MYMYHLAVLVFGWVFSGGGSFHQHDTQGTRRHITRCVRVSPDIGGARTGRRKVAGTGFEPGCGAPNHKASTM